MTQTDQPFIVIDDSELDCFVIQKVIEYAETCVITRTFNSAQYALDAIRANPAENGQLPTIILLDLQMPEMNGFEFVKEFEKFPPEVQNNYRIIILSIMCPEREYIDLPGRFSDGEIKCIIEKPLTTEKLSWILTQARLAN